MKQFNLLFVFVAICILIPELSFSQGIWSKLSDFGGGVRAYHVSFAHNNKIYCGQGTSGIPRINDFWEYDINTQIWKEISHPAGSARISAVAFAGSKYGFVGLGQTGSTTFTKSFYRFSFDSNTWTKIADFPGTGRNFLMSFVINDKAYVGGGFDGANSLKDFYCLDMTTLTWSTVAAFPGVEISSAYAFAIGEKGYIVCGENYMSTGGGYVNDVYEYDSKANTWTTKGKFPGNNRANGISFSINNKGYVVLGNTDVGGTNDTWEYQPSTDSWNKVTAFPGLFRVQSSCAVFDNQAYIMGGRLVGTDNTAELYSFTSQASGVSDIADKSNRVSVYPNPFSNYIEIGTEPGKEFTVEMYTLEGKLVLSESNNKVVEIPDAIESGLYMILIKSEKFSVSKKCYKF